MIYLKLSKMHGEDLSQACGRIWRKLSIKTKLSFRWIFHSSIHSFAYRYDNSIPRLLGRPHSPSFHSLLNFVNRIRSYGSIVFWCDDYKVCLKWNENEKLHHAVLSSNYKEREVTKLSKKQETELAYCVKILHSMLSKCIWRHSRQGIFQKC